jgi:hypothetical protein
MQHAEGPVHAGVSRDSLVDDAGLQWTLPHLHDLEHTLRHFGMPGVLFMWGCLVTTRRIESGRDRHPHINMTSSTHCGTLACQGSSLLCGCLVTTRCVLHRCTQTRPHSHYLKRTIKGMGLPGVLFMWGCLCQSELGHTIRPLLPLHCHTAVLKTA